MEQRDVNEARWIAIGFKFGIGFGLAGLIFAALGGLAAYLLHPHHAAAPAAERAAAAAPPVVVSAAPAQPAPADKAGERKHIVIPPKDGKTCLAEAHGLIDDNYEKCLKGSDYWTGGGSSGAAEAPAADDLPQLQNEWVVQLIAAINQHWTVPPGTNPAQRAVASIGIAPNGEVVSSSITAGSGVAAFDDSLLKAITQASPLPLPRDQAAFLPSVEICFSPDARNCQ